MKSKLTLMFVAALAISQTGHAFVELDYSEKNHMHDVFSVNKTNSAYYSYNYMPYKEWAKQNSGKHFPMSVSPVLEGMAAGQSKAPAPRGVDPSLYEGQAREFADVVNFKNEGGRPSIDLGDTAAADALATSIDGTHVVETVLSAVIDVPFNQLDLDPETITGMAEAIDLDHYHYQIPGSFVEEALEEGHTALNGLDLKKNYLLSVFDLRDYGCAVMKTQIQDYFSKNPDKDQLQNGSIYVISNVEMNKASDIDQAAAFFGRRPDAVVTQEALFADHLIRGAKTIFAFYSEGQQTRVVLLSNIAMGSKFFTGIKGAAIRQYLLNGIGGGITGAALKAKDAFDSLISGATDDMSSKNSCDRGLALGLIGYSQSLFDEFVNYNLGN